MGKHRVRRLTTKELALENALAEAIDKGVKIEIYRAYTRWALYNLTRKLNGYMPNDLYKAIELIQKDQSIVQTERDEVVEEFESKLDKILEKQQKQKSL